MKRKTVYCLVALFVAVHAALSIHLLYEDSLTSDEPIHMTAGYLAVKDQDLRINREHPPLAKALAGLGLLTGGFSFPYSDVSYQKGIQHELATRFLFGQGNDPFSMTARARWPFVLLSVGFCIFLFQFVRGLYGDRAGLISLLLYAFSPIVLAHNHLVTTDATGMILGFAGVELTLLALAGRHLGYAIAGATAIGLAIFTKFSCLMDLAFVVVFGALCLTFLRGRRVRLLLSIGLVVLVPTVIVLLGCQALGGNTTGGSGPIWEYLDGLMSVRKHVVRGHDHPQFLLGSCSFMGWWYYFPAAFMLKTSLFLQGLLALSLAQAFRKTTDDESRGRALIFHSLWLFPLCYTAYCMTTRLNIGFRHMMPVLPFLYAFIGVNMDRLLGSRSRGVRVLPLLLLAGYAASTLVRYPNCMGYFTEWAAHRPERYLNDSNLDWGQDLGRLSGFMDRKGIEHIRLDYFGPRGAPDAYLPGRYEPWSREMGLPEDGWFAVSEFQIMSSMCYRRMGVIPKDYGLLNTREPVARVGSSIRVYRFP